MKKITKKQLEQYIFEQTQKLYKAEILKEEKKKVEKKLALLEGRSYTVEFEYTDYSTGTAEGEKTYSVTCKVTPGSPGSFYRSNGDPGDPPEPSEVEIEEIVDTETGMPINIDSLSPEVLEDISNRAEEQENDYEPDEPDFDFDRDEDW